MSDPPFDPSTIGEALDEAARILKQNGIEDPEGNALRLVEHATGLDHGQVRSRRDRSLEATVRASLGALVARRAAREPLQHLLGSWPFLELELKVDRRALIPRPETEDVALAARARLAGSRAPLVADVGTGSGCLALALASELPAARVVALDRSADALALASENARLTGLSGRVRFVRGDLAGPLAPAESFDAIVANLPYVGRDESSILAPEVIDHEPHDALFADGEGLALIERLVETAPSRLAEGGWIVLEIAPRQAHRVRKLLASQRFVEVEVAEDRYGRPRIASGRRASGGA